MSNAITARFAALFAAAAVTAAMLTSVAGLAHQSADRAAATLIAELSATAA